MIINDATIITTTKTIVIDFPIALVLRATPEIKKVTA